MICKVYFLSSCVIEQLDRIHELRWISRCMDLLNPMQPVDVMGDATGNDTIDII